MNRPITCGALAALLMTSFAAAQIAPPSVLNPSDPALRLWLDSTSLVEAGLLEGDPVTSWVDKSSYGTILAPRTATFPNGPNIGDPVEENPHFQWVDIAGNMVPTVRFDRDRSHLGDPNVDGSGSTDRLFQQNNLAPGFDPLDIGDGSSLTTFVVFNPDVTTTLNEQGGPVLGYQAVYAKRGGATSVYELGINNWPDQGEYNFHNYDSVTMYRSATKPADKVWHVASQVVTDNPGAENVDTLQFFDAEGMDPNQTLTELGTIRPDGTPNNLIATRNASTPEPFALGATGQPCCGEGETFAGNIAEVIIFAKLLTPTEYSDVASYLSQKYFTPGTGGLAGDFDGDQDVDGDDLSVWKNQFGVLPVPAAPNADANGDGEVDGADLLVWQQTLNVPQAAAATGAIPEPATATLVMISLGALARSRKGLARSLVRQACR